jgi:hypothetical protein
MDQERVDPVADLEMMRHRADRRHARRNSLWLHVLFPFFLGTLAVAALVVWAGYSAIGDASSWADTSLTFLLLPLLMLCLLPLALIVALSYGLFILFGWLPEPLDKLDHVLGQVTKGTRRVTSAAVQPLIQMKAIWAGFSAGVARIGATLRGDRGERHD